MAGYSARQSSFTTGDTILAAHSNDEFNQVLAAFHATTGHSHDGTAGEGGPISTLRDADSNNKILVDTSNNHLEFYVEVSSAAVEQVKIQDGAIVPVTDNDIDLGTSSLEFKDLYVDGTAYVDAINYNGTAITSTAAELNIIDGDTSATSTTVADADRVVLNDGGTMKQVAVTDLAAYFDDEITAMPNVTSVGTLTTLTVDDITINGSTISDSGDFTIDGGADIILDADGGDVFFKDGGTTFGSATNTSGNLIIKSGTTTALTFSGADVTIAGDLTVSGDDITMGTNTAGNLLIADGTNFNSVAVGSLTEISTVADDDVFLAVDTSGGGLKKIARSAIVSGLATSSAISNVADDSTPQLGGDLDMNGQDIVTTSNADIELAPNGTGHVTIKGNTNQGTLQLNCENNSHGQQIVAAPHSESANNVLTLPSTGGNARLVSTTSTATLTNKTLTSPKINEDVAVTSTATELNLLDGVTATTTELNLIDGGSTIGTDAIADGDGIIHNDGGTMKVTSAATFKTYFTSGVSSAADDLTAGDAAVNLTTTSGNITIDAQAGDSDIIFKGTDSSSDITALTLDMSDAGTAVFNHDIKIADDGQIGSASAADAMIISSGGIVTFKDDILIKDGGTIGVASTADALTISSAGIVTFKDDILIKDGGTIGSASDADSITIASDGVVTFSQAPVFPDGSIAVADLDIDGATDIGADLVDADLFIVDDGAGGTNRKVAASRIKTYIGGGTQWQSVKTSNYTATAGQGVFMNTTSGALTLTLPASPSIGDEVTFVDYAGTFDSNNLTIARNSSKIHGAEEDLTVAVERAANTLVFTDSTQGWLLKSK